MKKLVVLSGAGISAESGLKTFRGEDGLWEGHDIMEVASPTGWRRDPALVLDFYNQRRRQLLQTQPNRAHLTLAEAEKHLNITVITQNIDDLHERAGSSNVIHLHGELLKVRSSGNPALVYPRTKDVHLGDLCEEQHQLRPDVVWFGEDVPMLYPAAEIVSTADHLLVVGTSLQVYPAASLLHYAPENCNIYLVDPRPTLTEGAIKNLKVIAEMASEGVPIVLEHLIHT